MSKLDRLIHMFRIPERDSGSAQWSTQDLLGSSKTVTFTWSKPNGTFDVVGEIDQKPAFSASFAVVAGSLRLKASEGFPDGVSGAKLVSEYLANLIMLGSPPVLSSEEKNRLSP